MKLVSILCDFHIFGGAQNVAIQIAKSMSDGESCPIMLTDTPKENIFKDYQKKDINFRRLAFISGRRYYLFVPSSQVYDDIDAVIRSFR